MFETYYEPINLGSKKNYSQGSPHLIKTHLFKFRDINKQEFIIEVEEYNLDTFVIKFYPKKHQNNQNKYSLISQNYSGTEATKIIRTCVEVMRAFYRKREEASFAFIGAAKLGESPNDTQRFRIYTMVMENFFKPVEFQHVKIPIHSLYILVNVEALQNNNRLHIEIWDMLNATYIIQ